MIHIIYQNIDHKGAGKMSDNDFSRLSKSIHSCYHIFDEDINKISQNDVVIFVYNEDSLFMVNDFMKDMNQLISLENKILKKGCSIYNKPSLFRVYGCKYTFYHIMKNEPFVPKFKVVECESDISKIDFYPVILTLTVRCLGNCRYL